jgi:chromosome segregation protein
LYLKSLTLRGFKSFASSTILRFEPGITCVVGPNGCGKSNVVDALAWVMGEQGAKTLRGGKMEDVIFAGTAARPPLGRAEVTVTIDNAEGALPIDYTEVTISRTMFRNGGSDYAINGQPCRLLDIQELLSDSGIGREMHVIVGQGQLESILAAGPDERRGFVEEAAGVLKHRKRKEKALRKLDAMQANLTRLSDLTNELRRQLKPLGKQAEVARRAAVIQADLRDARLRLCADDLVQLTAALEQEVADEQALLARRTEVERALASARTQEAALEEHIRTAAGRLAETQETWYRLSSVRDRLRGMATLAAERMRNLAEETDEFRPARDPDEMEAEARLIRAEEQQLASTVTQHTATLAAAVRARETAEQAADAEERRLAALLRAVADRREGLARLTGQVETMKSRLASAEAEIGRLSAARNEAHKRAAAAEREFAALEVTIGGLADREERLDAAHETALRVERELAAQIESVAALHRQAEQERAALAARIEALELGLARRDGSGSLLAANDQLSGVLGSVAALLTVAPGAETAVATALGPAADAVAVEELPAAFDALARLKDEDLGRAALLVASGPNGRHGASDTAWTSASSWPELPAGVRYVVELVTAPPNIQPVLARLLDRVAVVDDVLAARALLIQIPGVVAVTRDGDLVGADFVLGGSATAPTLLEVQAAMEDARERLATAALREADLVRRVEELEARRLQATEEVATTLTRLNQSDAELAAIGEQLGQLGATQRAATAEAQRLTTAIDEAAIVAAEAAGQLAELEARLAAASVVTDDDTEPSYDERDRLAALAHAARQSETEARLSLRTSEERLHALADRAAALERAAAEERHARIRMKARQERRAREAERARQIARAAQVVLARLENSLATAAEQRQQASAVQTEAFANLTTMRSKLRQREAELAELSSSVHRDEVVRAEQRMRIEALQARVQEEFGITPEVLVQEYGPTVPVPSVASEGPAEPIPYVRAEQEKRARTAERELALLGQVNPLALEEFAALEERYGFLTEQLEDLRKTRHDLLEIVREVDERVEQVFTEAYRDVARAFAEVFPRLFPGGEGRLVLTDPSDMLTTGIDVEARPPGKKIKRLSLLSGGERSLVAVAFLIALFKARPSPFYVLDEVEAALDDINLGRLLEIFEELRDTSQLIVITHQKRTMEVADALYGMSMRGDGVTAVIGQRLREAQPA